MNKKLIGSIFIIIGVVLFIFMLVKFPLLDAIRLFMKAPLLIVLLYLFATTIAVQMTNTLRWSVVLNSLGCYVPITRLVSYRLVGYGISFLTPAAKLGGEPVRAAILQRDGIPLTKGASATLIDKFIEFSLSFTFFVVGTAVFVLFFNIPLFVRVIVLTICAGALLLLVMLYSRLFKGKGFMIGFLRITRLERLNYLKSHKKKIIEIEELMKKFFKHDKKYFVLSLFITLAAWIFMFVEFKLAMEMMRQSVTIPQIFFIFSAVGAAYTIPIPLALGVLEASQVSLMTFLGFSAATGLALALLIKLKDLILTGIGLGFLGAYGLDFKKTYQNAIKEIEDSI